MKGHWGYRNRGVDFQYPPQDADSSGVGERGRREGGHLHLPQPVGFGSLCREGDILQRLEGQSWRQEGAQLPDENEDLAVTEDATTFGQGTDGVDEDADVR